MSKYGRKNEVLRYDFSNTDGIMILGWIDWTIVAGFLVLLLAVAAWTRRYTRSVSDYLAANRCAGRYLLTLSDGMAALGAIAVIANFEKFYHAGFAASWWGFMMGPLGMVAALSGWVVYRYRETRAMTMAQFFEMRYGRSFRIFSGILCFVSGILNYGVFPGVTAKFLVYFCGLPVTVRIAGVECQTYLLLMALLLTAAALLALCGGFIAIMITDFIQGQLVYITFLGMAFFLLWYFSWGDLVGELSRCPPGKSMLDPFDQADIRDFNLWFFLIFGFKIFYNCLGWQSNQAYNCAAKSPHEARMAKVLGSWREQSTYLLFLLAPICAYVFLNSEALAAVSAPVRTALAGIADPQLRSQLTVTQVLAAVLPSGMLGLFCLAMICAALSTDDTCLHSWGSIFIQDVVMPFRSTPLTPEQHLRWLRWAVVGVAGFAFCWSWIFPLKDYLFMYFLLTGTIYLGGSGAVIIGGLYWRRATTAGAYAALITGGLTAVIGISLQIVWTRIPALTALTPSFPLNGVWLAMVAYVVSITAFVAVSRLTCRHPFDLDRLLHRGPYAENVSPATVVVPVVSGWRQRWARRLGVTPEFTRGDKWIFGLNIAWTMFWFAAFLVGTVCHFAWGIPASWWPHWWSFMVMLSIAIASVTLVWFIVGGTLDLKSLVRHLATIRRDSHDDGWVEEKETPLPPDDGKKTVLDVAELELQ